MAEESVKQKMLRVARKVLVTDPHRRGELENTWYVLIRHAGQHESSNPHPPIFPTVMLQEELLFLHDSRFQSQIN